MAQTLGMTRSPLEVVHSGVEIKKKKDVAKWEGKIGRTPTLLKLFMKVIKSQWGDLTPMSPPCIRLYYSLPIW